MFNIKTWIDRVSEFPTRRLLTKVSDGTSEQVIVTRDEGTVTTAGDTFDANTMNNLEARIASAFTADDQKMGDLADLETTAKSSLVAAINEAAQGGSGGGSSTLAGLNDVDLTTPANGQVLKYNSTSQKWENANESGGGGSAEHALTFTYSTTLQYSQITDANDFTYVSTVDETGATVAAADVYDLLLAGYNAYMKLIIYAGNVNEQVYTINLGKKMYVANGAGSISLNFAYADESSCFTISTSLETHGDDATASDFYFEFYFIAYPDEARNVIYDASISGLQATNVNDAIDEVADAIDDKADIASPAFTGTSTAPTPTAGDDSTKIATTAFVQNELDDINSNYSYDAQASANVPSQTSPFTNIASFSLTAGTWLVIATVNFPSNTSGYRSALISATSGASGADYRATILVSPVSGDVTRVQVMAILTPTSTTTYYVEAKQNSGSSLSVTARVQRIKLK